MNASFKKYVAPLVIAIVLFSNLAFGLTRLGNYSSVDEPYWTYGRITKFWNGIKAHKWKTTSVNDKPGITVAILSGAGLIKMDPMPYKGLRGDVKTEAQLKDINDINFFFRLPIYLFCVLLLPLFYVLLRKLFDETTALIAFTFIGLSPILLGISLIINPDSLLWVFLPLSLLSYFVYQKHATKKYLLLSGFFLGLALLTKYVANILYIFFFLLPFFEYLFAREKPDIRSHLGKAATDYIMIVLVSMLVFFILYPATWVNPQMLLEGTFLSKAFKTTWPLFAGAVTFIAFDGILFRAKITAFVLDFLSKYRNTIVGLVVGISLAGIFFVLFNTYTHMSILDSTGTLASPKGTGDGSRLLVYADKISADIFSLIFALSPLALFSFVTALALSFKKSWRDSYEAKIVFLLTCFILFYYLASTVNSVVATVRYQIALYPLAFIIAAIGLSRLLSLEQVRKYLSPYAAYAIIFVVSLVSLLGIKPFYFAYASSLLPNQYFVNFKDMGDGSYEAAAYLNSLPHPETLIVWSDKGAVCAVFKGKCIIGFTDKRVKGVSFDYVVVSSGRKSRTLKMWKGAKTNIDFPQAYEAENADFKVAIGERPNNYVKVFTIDKVTKQP